jgi:hypothetical protein
MEVVLASLTVREIAEVMRQGGSHPLLGGLLEQGTYCRVVGAGLGAGEMCGLFAAAGEEAARRRLPIAVCAEPPAADLERARQQGALCLVVVDGAAGPPLAILCGRGLPILGAVQPCTLADLEHTWISLAGGVPQGGRHLLHEQPEAWDLQLERKLTERLRELYGE